MRINSNFHASCFCRFHVICCVCIVHSNDYIEFLCNGAEYDNFDADEEFQDQLEEYGLVDDCPFNKNLV